MIQEIERMRISDLHHLAMALQAQIELYKESANCGNPPFPYSTCYNYRKLLDKVQVHMNKKLENIARLNLTEKEYQEYL